LGLQYFFLALSLSLESSDPQSFKKL
jgi:hypothetical protein